MDPMDSPSLLRTRTPSKFSTPVVHPFATPTNSSFRGLWPNPYENNGYIKEGGHIIKTHDNGYVGFKFYHSRNIH
jgi:hypothetical protein